MFGGMFSSLFNGPLSLIKPLTKMLGLVPELPDQPRDPGKPPGPDDAAVQAAAEAARIEARKRYGRQQTIATSALGDTSQVETKKTLLGGS
jgi:hypothetical protein